MQKLRIDHEYLPAFLGSPEDRLFKTITGAVRDEPGATQWMYAVTMSLLLADNDPVQAKDYSDDQWE